MLSLMDCVRMSPKNHKSWRQIKANKLRRYFGIRRLNLFQNKRRLHYTTLPIPDVLPHPRHPTTNENYPTSFGTCSTESTPNKLVHPETKMQSLQDVFVETLLLG